MITGTNLVKTHGPPKLIAASAKLLSFLKRRESNSGQARTSAAVNVITPRTIQL